ncbi:FixH family protein [Halomonas beimenensis]|uniref:Cytochrome c oxidase (Cbb3-type) subunit CcoH-like protein n=1 Tax=Halomonas beimenensis TaxID=475662 RepID=A0A291P494_9GAMM|nr:FixH family protein [Halomonas beimenensis]ATJ81689.1 cytochrome c oxidase (cbb3-type) subunit CcoH-like protein [Halomonas beimenensis]
MTAEHEHIPPWYKQFWPWFLIGLLGSSVAFSLVYLTLSIRYFDGTVAQDYYKEGLAINERIAKQEQASALGLAATLRADPATGDIVVDLNGEPYPEQLVLKLIFPTESARDRTLTLEHVRAGRYVTMLEEPLRYRWYLHLQPEEGPEAAWRLTGEARFPTEDEIALLPGI